jgi:predicted ArsR family transcriptional regulator
VALHLGDRLGLYTGLHAHGPATAGELAAGAGIDKRYAREWLEQQTVAGLLEVDAAHASPKMRRQRHAQQGGSRGCSPL